MESPRVNAESGPGKQHSRQAIFDAAKRLFAEKGFAGTSIREITSEAGCNLAAVNYYFHGKDKLYLEVLTQTLVEFREESISSISEVKRRDCPPTLESLLRSFAQAFLKPFVMGQQQLLKLLIHEMTNRRLPEGLLFKEVIEPVETTLIKVLKRLCPEIDNACARRCISSVVAQLIHVVHSQRLFSDRLERRQGDFDLTGTVDHIVCFSAAGIRACCKEKP
ncbi:MAG: TetR/AcrR family transcriptional regulator [Deltaproteobacteria bacterium]|nr:TetR/AcrR family transcriptional regulator [Deltaproteobacteria bacterium]